MAAERVSPVAVTTEEPTGAQPAPAMQRNQVASNQSPETMSASQRGAAFAWLVVSFAAFATFLAGLSALQQYIKHSQNTAFWTIQSNFPYLAASHVFRWDWWVLFGYLLVWLLVLVIVVMQRDHQWRACLVGLLTAFAVFWAFEADRFYNMRSFVAADQGQRRAATSAMVGALVGSLAFFMLPFCIGVSLTH